MNWLDIAKMTLQTLLMTFIATVLAYLIGLPIGVLLNVTSKKGLKPNKAINLIVGFIVNLFRSIPCLILVVLCMPITREVFQTGTGKWFTILIPLVVASFGFVARIVEQSLSEVPSGELEAVKSLGSTDIQLIFKVLLPEARASLVSGIAVSSVAILGYTSFAYNIGAGGLISEIWVFYSRNSGDYSHYWYFWILIIMVIIIVQGIQEIGLLISKKIDKRRILK